MRRFTAVVVIGLFLLAMMTMPALAQDYPPDAPSVAVSDTTVVAGETITVSSSGWLPGSDVTVTFLTTSEVLGTAEVGADGAFQTRVTIPSDASPGVHTLRVTGTGADGEPASVDIRITVEAVAAALPVTGLNLTVGTVLSTVLIAAGVTALLISRRRRTSAPAQN